MIKIDELPLPAKPSTARRIVAGVAVVLFIAYTLFLLRQSVRMFERFGYNPLDLLLMCYSVTGAILCGWYALSGHSPESRRHIRLTIRAGWIIGGLGFVVGFIGPLVVTPESNLGPMLGIFVTGPLGFVFGAVIGWLYGRFRHDAMI